MEIAICFLKKAGIFKVNYNVDRPSLEKDVRKFLKDHDFDFNFLKSRTYVSKFLLQLDNKDKQILVEYLTDFANQPFSKPK